MKAIETLKSWIEQNCPNIWSILNLRAKSSLPHGIIEYISTPDLTKLKKIYPDCDAKYLQSIAEDYPARGKENLISIDLHIKELTRKCGFEIVCQTYRRDISGVSTEESFIELLSEIAFCSAISVFSQSIKLRPPTGKGTYSDISFEIDENIIYGELKRYEDKPFFNRSIKKTSPGSAPPCGVSRPRSMDLISKLQKVFLQFPDDKVNILFVLHPSYGESATYLRQALFGQNLFFENMKEPKLSEDGLFALEEWRIISSCYLIGLHYKKGLICFEHWNNPKALIKTSEEVSALFEQFKKIDISLEDL